MDFVAKRFTELSLDEYHELLKLRCAAFPTSRCSSNARNATQGCRSQEQQPSNIPSWLQPAA